MPIPIRSSDDAVRKDCGYALDHYFEDLKAIFATLQAENTTLRESCALLERCYSPSRKMSMENLSTDAGPTLAPSCPAPIVATSRSAAESDAFGPGCGLHPDAAAMPPLIEGFDAVPKDASVTRERSRKRCPNVANDFISAIVFEYNQKIAELTRLTEDLPRRLCAGIAQDARAQKGAGTVGVPCTATLDSKWQHPSTAVALPAKDCEDAVAHPEEKMDSFHNSISRNGSSHRSGLENSSNKSVVRMSDGAETFTSDPSGIDPLSKLRRLSSTPVLVRLQLRLGVRDWHGTVSAQDLHTAVTCLGLEKYSVQSMEKLVARLVRASPEAQEYLSNDPEPNGVPRRSFLKRATREFSFGSSLFGDDKEKVKIPTLIFADFLLSTTKCKKMGKEYEDMIGVIREILVAGDANRLIAELTCVRIDDLAAPPPVMDWEIIFEPIVGVVILFNGIVIGLQTEPRMENWGGWAWVETVFATLYALELTIRIWIAGILEYYCGPDSYWSFFDTFIVCCAIMDTIFEFFLTDYKFNMTAFALARIIRLTRLTRLFRIFRLGFLRELTIMVKGLFAGFRTFLWANVLLFFTIYLIAVFATFTVGKSDRTPWITQDRLFTTVPRSMLTWFRCFVGDCNTSRGEPIVKLLSDAHGFPFIMFYLASFTMVTLGLFNLITALYVDIAMAAAKRTEEQDKSRARRESLRVAHVTKNLLKKFCAAQRHISDPRHTSVKEVSEALIAKCEDQDIDDSQTISSELFLLIIQDQEVQRLMNDLDIPPDRANLFDVLDADGTGDLHVTELVHGLLKVRGEARKSDVIASLLAIRAVQEMLRLFEDKMTETQETIMEHLGINRSAEDRQKSSIWASKNNRQSCSFQFNSSDG